MRLLTLLALITTSLSSSSPYYGNKVGTFSTKFHDVKGDVFAVDDKTLYISNFNYDGKGTDAVFWAGSSNNVDGSGFEIPYNKDANPYLGAYNNQNVILHLPEGKKVGDFRWLAVWSRRYSTSFGSLYFPKSFSAPRPRTIGPLTNTKPGISTGNILILDSQTFLIPEFNYDGSGPGIYWRLSKGETPNGNGLLLTQEDGSELPLQEHQNRTVIVTLPDGHSVFEYNFLQLWSPSEIQHYGAAEIEDMNIPPSPRALGLGKETEGIKLNCEMLNDNLGLEVRWHILGNDITIHLVGNIGYSEYMALGLSKDDTETRFDAADAAVAWIDAGGKGHIEDYFFETTNVCENGVGMCPDAVHPGFTNDLTLLSTKKFSNKTIVTFQRSLKADDKTYDQNIYTDGPQAILWAVGPIQREGLIGPPKLRTRGNLLLDFGRDPNWNCPKPRDETVSHEQQIPQAEKEHEFQIYCPNNYIFRAQMGPSTHDRSKNVWYINGLPTPKLTVRRGQEYTFIVEGGMGPSTRNPLYITNSTEGGLYQNLLEASDIPEVFFAGVHQDAASGIYLPTSEGRLCQWSISDTDPEGSITTSHSERTSALTVSCEPGNYAKLLWTPSFDTPNEVYYQSFTTKNIGGIIQVLDFCEESRPTSYLENVSSNTAGESFPNIFNSKPETERENEDERSESPHSKVIIDKDGIKLETENEGDYIDLKPISNFDHIDRETEDHDDDFDSSEGLDDNVLYKKNIHNEREKEITFNPSSFGEKNNEGPIKNAEDFHVNKESSNEELDVSLVNVERINLGVSQPLLKDSLLPHDESERSDKNVHSQQTSEAKESFAYNNVPTRFQTQPEKVSSVARVENSHAAPQNGHIHLQRLSSSRFKPQFEGGFVPLVLNPSKEKESTLIKEFDVPPMHLRRPHRPFLFNESIPFHGSFKPGVPDFSGFNISHYSQDESSYPLNQVLDNLPMLSAPNPQVIRRPFASVNSLPQMQRPQIFGYAPRSKEPGFVFYQQSPMFAQLPKIRIQNSQEDLAEVSSQRVQVALQASGDKGKRVILPQLQIMRNQNRKQKTNPQPNTLIHAPPIQRRPDFVGEGEAPANPPIVKPTRPIYHLDRRPINNNKNIENQRVPSALESSRLRNPFGIRGPVPFPKPSFNLRERENGPLRVPPPGLLRAPHPFIQGPQRTLLPQVPGKHLENTQRLRNPSLANIVASYPLSARPPIINPKSNTEENVGDNKNSEDTSSSVTKEQTVSSTFLNPEQVDTLEKHLQPQIISVGQKNALGIPGLFLSHSRPHISPLTLNKDMYIKKLLIPLRDSQSKSNFQYPLPLQIDSLASEHSFNQKVDNYRSKFIQNQNNRLLNTTAPNDSKEVLDSFPNENAHETKEEFSPINDSAVATDNSNMQEMFLVENDSENTEDADYMEYDVPFGARLKPNEGKPKIKVTSSDDKRQPTPSKKPITVSYAIAEKTIEAHIAETHGVNNQNNEALPESSDHIPNITVEDKESQTYTEISSIPFFSTTETPPTSTNDNKNEAVLNYELENVPYELEAENIPQRFAALFLDNDTLEKHNGRKNILHSTSDSSSESLNVPPVFPENINLPQISNLPPTHDNGTDYSILNHVLSLIGGAPES